MSVESQQVGWAALLRPVWFPALAVLMGGVLLHSMNVLMMATVLPSIVQEVGGASLMSLSTTAALASAIVASACTNYLAAVLGARRVYAIGALIFGTGALLCALAPTMTEVIVGRFVQGFGGGMLTALAYVLMRTTFPEAVWTRAITLLSGVWSFSVLLGPLIGGTFATYGDWRGAFYAVATSACFLAALVVYALPRTLVSDGSRPRIPGLRIALITLAILVVSVAAVTSITILKAVLFPAALALLIVVLAVDRRATVPLLPRDAFSLRTTTGIGLWLALLLSASFSPLQLYVPTFLRVLHGLDPLAAGYVVAGGSLGWTAASTIVAGASPRWIGRLLVCGPLFMAAALLGLASLTTHQPFVLMIPPIVLMGIGMGSCSAFVAQRVMSGARKGDETAAASSLPTVQQIGTALGAALAGLIANLAGLSAGLGVAEVTTASYWVPGCFVAIALVAAVVGTRLR